MATQELAPKVNVDNFHYIPITSDVTGSIAYDEAVAIPGSVKVGLDPDAKSDKFYADGGVYSVATSIGEVKLSLECADVTPQILADWFGQDYVDGMFSVKQLKAKYFGCAYRVEKANGAYRYIRVLKGVFTMPKQEAETRKNSTSFGTTSVEFGAVKRMSDSLVYQMLDSDDPKLPNTVTAATIEEKWYSDFTWKPTTVAGS